MTTGAPLAVPLVLMGLGPVGRAFVERLLGDRNAIAARLGLHVDLAAVSDSSGILQSRDGPLPEPVLRSVLVAKASGGALADWHGDPGRCAFGPVLDPSAIERPDHVPILVDATAADTTRSLLDARRRGWRVAVANKIPLTGSMDAFRGLTDEGRGARWETTVASSLPVVATLQALLDQGDRVRWISGTLSGTLGVVCAALERGEAFSHAVRGAVRDGLSEPDPRRDLDGRDVARKALILGRMLGYDLPLAAVERKGLLPEAWSGLEAGEVLDRLPELDADLAEWAHQHTGSHIRFLASIGDGRVRARLVALDPGSPLARADAADSVVTFETDGFSHRPLVISGRGGGPLATARGLLGDVVSLGREARPTVAPIPSRNPKG